MSFSLTAVRRLLLPGVAAATLAFGPAARAEIHIGVVLSLTGPGASLCIPEANALKLLTGHLAGEKVRFTFHNGANVDHEALLGDIAAQNAHEKMMKAMGTAGDAHHMAGPGYVFVAAGTTASLDYTFTRVGRSIIGCHQPGHWASGMRIDVVVDPRTALG